MATRRLLDAAPKLLAAVKSAIRTVSSEDISGSWKEPLLAELTSALCEAEEQDWYVEFVTTPRTADLIFECYQAKPDAVRDTDVMGWLEAGMKKTARRVYFRLPVDVDLVNRFIYFLRMTNPGRSTSRAFDRIADQLRDEVANQSPLEILARSGL